MLLHGSKLFILSFKKSSVKMHLNSQQIICERKKSYVHKKNLAYVNKMCTTVHERKSVYNVIFYRSLHVIEIFFLFQLAAELRAHHAQASVAEQEKTKLEEVSKNSVNLNILVFASCSAIISSKALHAAEFERKQEAVKFEVKSARFIYLIYKLCFKIIKLFILDILENILQAHECSKV